jgi:hypothetical protein
VLEAAVRLVAGAIGDRELGGVGVGVERVGGDDHAGQLQGRQQRQKAGNLLGRAADLALGQDRAAGVVHRGQQVQRAAVAVWGAGAAQRLAVDRGGQGVGVKPAQRAADGGLGRRRPMVGSVAAGAERGADRLGGVGGPLGDGGK